LAEEEEGVVAGKTLIDLRFDVAVVVGFTLDSAPRLEALDPAGAAVDGASSVALIVVVG